MNKEEIKVSVEVKTYLMDLYSQIEYELQDQYNDEVQKLQQENQKYKEVINKLNDLLSDEFLEVIDRDTLLDILKEVE